VRIKKRPTRLSAAGHIAREHLHNQTVACAAPVKCRTTSRRRECRQLARDNTRPILFVPVENPTQLSKNNETVMENRERSFRAGLNRANVE
jgi:hypothetical protein